MPLTHVQLLLVWDSCYPGRNLSIGQTSLLLPRRNFSAKKVTSLWQPRTSGSTPQLFQTFCMQPLQQLGSGVEMWLLPEHMTVYCCCCQLTHENNANNNSEQPWPNRLISRKKLFPRKEQRQHTVIDGWEHS